jgi:pimeloyl-ACP methyl ester carboxylesterase
MAVNRRGFLKTAGLASVRLLNAQADAPATPNMTRTIQTPVLEIAYEDTGAGFPVILLHGFPDDVHAWDDVTPPLVQAGYRVLVPYLRGYGATRFRDPATPRLGEQAAIGQDLIDFADALKLPRFAVAGYDWGGRAACIAAALHAERVRAAVLIGGYSIQNTVAAPQPGPPEAERALWYQWYFNTERGRAGLAANRHSLCRLLWETWSPGWHFSDETYNRTALSFDNPDFVDVVIHSYRHRIGNAPGEPRFEAMEQELARRPKIQVPSLVLYGANDGIARPSADASPGERASFTAPMGRRVIDGAGHFLPREKPQTVSSGILELLASAP